MITALAVSGLLILVAAATRLVHRFEARHLTGRVTPDRPTPPS